MGVNLNHHARAKNLFWVFLTGIFCSLTLQGLHVYPLQGPNLSAALWESHFRGWFLPPGQVLHWAWNHPRHTKVLPGPSPRPLRHPIAPSPSPLKWPPLRLHPFKHPLPMKGGQGFLSLRQCKIQATRYISGFRVGLWNCARGTALRIC